MTSPLVPTPIVNKNGVPTTVHKKPVSAQGTASNFPMLGTPSTASTETNDQKRAEASPSGLWSRVGGWLRRPFGRQEQAGPVLVNDKGALRAELTKVIGTLSIPDREKNELLKTVHGLNSPPMLRAFIRLLPTNGHSEITTACFDLSRCKNDHVTMTIDDLTPSRLELYREFTQQSNSIVHHEQMFMMMQELDEYPEITSAVRDRGIMVASEAVEMARVIRQSASASLSDGML